MEKQRLNNMYLQGKIYQLGETQQVTDSFRKRELVIKTEEQYPQTILIEFLQDKCDVLNNYRLGDNVKVAINIRGREWTNEQGEVKYFNSINGWRIEKIDIRVQPQFEPATDLSAEEHDNLPF